MISQNLLPTFVLDRDYATEINADDFILGYYCTVREVLTVC